MMIKSSGYRKMCRKSSVDLNKVKVFVEGSLPGGYDNDPFVRPSLHVPRFWKFFLPKFFKSYHFNRSPQGADRIKAMVSKIGLYISVFCLLGVYHNSAWAEKDKVAQQKRVNRKSLKGSVGPRIRNEKPIYTRRLLKLTLSYAKGRVFTRQMKVTPLKKKVKLPRYQGRFEARLYRKGRLVERLNFDFPMLGMAESFTKKGAAIWLKFERGLKSHVEIKLPWDKKFDDVRIFDHKLKKVTSVPLSLLKKHGMTVLVSSPRRGGAEHSGSRKGEERSNDQSKSKNSKAERSK